MEKILLAVGFRQLEEYLEKQLKKEFQFVGSTVYREGVVRAIGQKKPDIVIIRETLAGNENIMSIIYEIRSKFPKTRIVFVAGKREAGDELLATLVNYGVYDILQGEKIQANQIISLIRKPNEYKDVKHLQPVPVLDEQKNKVLFQAPQATETEIIKEIYVENSSPMLEKKPNVEPNLSAVKTTKILNEVEDETPTKPKKGFLSKIAGITESVKSDNQSVQNQIFASPNISQIEKSKQKTITFIGGKGGVGTTSLALNTSVLLAQRGYEVIFIEFNDITPSVSYWYELGLVGDGIDTCLTSLAEGKFDKINDAIITSKSLKTKESSLAKNYRKFPDTLDFLFFSQQHLANENKKFIDLSMSKELYLYLMFQLDYDFIILDVPYDISNQASLNGLIYSNKVFTVVTQDVCSIGYNLYNVHELEKKGINLSKKNYYIVNKFQKTNLTIKEIQKWIETDNILTIPIENKEFINSSFIGLPVCLYTKNPNLKSSLSKIESIIL